MTFEEALRVIVDAHTDHDEWVGYVVHGTAASRLFTAKEYREAWGVVRERVYPDEMVKRDWNPSTKTG